jgi:hypothetical protein
MRSPRLLCVPLGLVSLLSSSCVFLPLSTSGEGVGGRGGRHQQTPPPTPPRLRGGEVREQTAEIFAVNSYSKDLRSVDRYRFHC